MFYSFCAQTDCVSNWSIRKCGEAVARSRQGVCELHEINERNAVVVERQLTGDRSFGLRLPRLIFIYTPKKKKMQLL